MKKSKMIGKKEMCVLLSMAMVLGIAGCGSKEVKQESVITEDNQEQVLNELLSGQVKASHSSDAGKEETVYVLADANGRASQVIVSDWLKNGDGGVHLTDCSDLTDIQNVKGYETYETDENGNIIWQADGSDIYYRGNSQKEVPVEVKVSYRLDGKEISPDELAGKSGRVTIRMDYENKETKKITIGGKEQEIKIPFAMISGMILPQDTFSNIEVTNARLLSEGNNSVVVGVALPGLKESIQMEEIKDKIRDEEQKEKLDKMEIPDYIEISADTDNFELGMTMTIAMSNILSDIELTDSFDLSDLNASMDDLRDATDQLKDGTTQLKDGSGKLKDGTGELLEGTDDLLDGALELKDGTQELFEKSGLLNDGAVKLNDGALALYDGTVTLQDGTAALLEGGKKLQDGTRSLVSGMKNLNNGAGQVKSGVEQTAAKMNELKAGIGMPVDSLNGTPSTLLELSFALNQSIKAMDGANGVKYDAIINALKQQREQAADNQASAQANADQAQNRAADAQAELMAACAGSTEQIEVVTGSHIETESNTETWEEEGESTESCEEEASEDGEDKEGEGQETVVIHTQTYVETVTTQREVPDTEVREVKTVDVENLQRKINDYQSALEDAAAYQAQAEAYSLQVESIDAQIDTINAYAAQSVDPYQQLVGLAFNMQQQLEGISKQLNDSSADLAKLVNGAGVLAEGTQTALAGASELNSGASELTAGVGSLSDGAMALKDGAEALKDGTVELKDGTGQLVEGTETLNDGAGTLKDGVNTLKDGVLTLDEGMGSLDEGALELLDGMFEFDEEGISKLTELFGDDVQDVVDRLQAVSDAGKEYNTFTKLPKDMDGSVKFIIKTEAIK